MPLRWRIMGSTVFVIILTVLISIGVGYYATQSRLGVFVDEISNDEANQLARSLSREYTAAGGWATVDRPLSEAGYLYDGIPQRERHEESGGESSEFFHRDPIRVVIVGVDGRGGEGQLLRTGTRSHRTRPGWASRDGVRSDYGPARGPHLRGCEPRVPVG